jgi:tetratricopeptide (TPR) repeat protein
MTARLSAFIFAFAFKQMAIWALIFNRRDLAIRYWIKIRKLKPSDPLIVACLAHLKAEIGAKDEAILLLKESLALSEAQPLAWYNLGFLQQELGQHEAAIKSFDQAIQRNDRADLAYYGKAISCIKLARIEEAVPLLKRNIELQPMSPYGFYQLAYAYQRLGQTERVKKTILRLRGFEPTVAAQLQRELGIDSQ